MQIKVNGAQHTFNGDPEMPLLWYLRDELRLTGTKFGCGIALCGACTVHKNGEAIRSCVTRDARHVPARRSPRSKASANNGLHPVQKAWMQVNVPQCGYCQPGQIMQAAALLNDTEEARPIRRSMKRWPATSAAVEPTSAFVRRSRRQRREAYERD